MHTKLRPSGARRGYPGAESGQREPRGHLPGAHGSWPRSPSYHKAFHDVTTGNNQVTAGPATAGYQASPGWDPVTGWGSPDALVLVRLLARFASSSQPSQNQVTGGGR